MFFSCRIRDKELQHHHHKEDLGREGKYRRTSSPPICSTPNVRPSTNSTSITTPTTSQKSQIKSPARTPKRDSPATIAAKGKNLWPKGIKNLYQPTCKFRIENEGHSEL